jgi:hypothetical protein
VKSKRRNTVRGFNTVPGPWSLNLNLNLKFELWTLDRIIPLDSRIPNAFFYGPAWYLKEGERRPAVPSSTTDICSRRGAPAA